MLDLGCLFEFSKAFLVRIPPSQLKFCQLSDAANLQVALEGRIGFLGNKLQGETIKSWSEISGQKALTSRHGVAVCLCCQ